MNTFQHQVQMPRGVEWGINTAVRLSIAPCPDICIGTYQLPLFRGKICISEVEEFKFLENHCK